MKNKWLYKYTKQNTKWRISSDIKRNIVRKQFSESLTSLRFVTAMDSPFKDVRIVNSLKRQCLSPSSRHRADLLAVHKNKDNVFLRKCWTGFLVALCIGLGFPTFRASQLDTNPLCVHCGYKTLYVFSFE